MSQMHVFTKFIDTDFVNLLNVYINHNENNSFVKILIVKCVEFQIKINNINQILLQIDFQYRFMFLKRDTLIIDIQNVLNKINDFLTILINNRFF